MIRKSNEINANTKYRILLYGVPGIAKSTTALSAPNPLVIDTDRGWNRVPVQFRKGDYTQPETYEELLSDLNGDMSKYETLVFDTGGSLLDLMKAYVIRQSPKNGQKDGTTLSMQGYGAVGREFSRLMNHCYFTLCKHVVIIFHAKEEKDGEDTKIRLDVEGATKNNIWKNMDVGGFIEMRGNKRVVGFSPTERYFAKGTHGISGEVDLPNVMTGAPNTFLSELFGKFKDSVKEELVMSEQYDALMATVRKLIDTGVLNEASANMVLQTLKESTHYFASKMESWTLLKEKADSLGLTFKDGTFQAATK